MPSLYDLSPLERLRPICSRLGLSVQAFGGIVTRNRQRIFANDARANDLFALTPFAADVDLIHSGPPAVTAGLMRAILAEIPAAECFRWQVRSRTDDRIYSEARRCNNIIPARLIELSTDEAEGMYDPWNGDHDIRTRSYRLIRNGFYEQSPLFKSGRDLECLSALIYMQVIFDAELEVGQIAQQPGIPIIREIFQSASNVKTVIALQQSAYLRSRFFYLLANAIVAAPSRDAVNLLFEDCGLNAMLEYFRRSDHNLIMHLNSTTLQNKFAIVSSARLGGDIFRTADHTTEWETGPIAVQQANQIFSRLAAFSSNPSILPSWAPGFRVLFCSPDISINSGAATCFEAAPGVANGEFLHFALYIDTAKTPLHDHDFEEDDLTAILAVGASEEFQIPYLCSPYSCGLPELFVN